MNDKHRTLKLKAKLRKLSKLNKDLDNRIKIAKRALNDCKDTKYWNPITERWENSVIQWTIKEPLSKL